MSLSVIAIVGTKGAFDRLVDALAAFRERHPDATVWVQHGPGRLPPALEGAPMVRRDALLARMDAADVVVTHAGSGSVRDALALGHRPVVVPRLARYGEHINDHQLELVEALAARVEAVTDLTDLDAAIARAAVARGPAATDGGARLRETVRAELEAAAGTAPWRRRLTWRALRVLTALVPTRPHRWEP